MTRWAKEYGSIYKFSLFGNVNVVLSDPSFMKEVMRTKVRYCCSCDICSMYHTWTSRVSACWLVSFSAGFRPVETHYCIYRVHKHVMVKASGTER